MKELTCIGCPIGCALKVEIRENEICVSGYNCNRGVKYAKTEVTSPVRSVTSTVKLIGGKIARLSVRTARDIPKDKIFDCMAEIQKVQVHSPVKIGDVVLANCAGTGVDVIATKNA